MEKIGLGVCDVHRRIGYSITMSDFRFTAGRRGQFSCKQLVWAAEIT